MHLQGKLKLKSAIGTKAQPNARRDAAMPFYHKTIRPPELFDHQVLGLDKSLTVLHHLHAFLLLDMANVTPRLESAFGYYFLPI